MQAERKKIDSPQEYIVQNAPMWDPVMSAVYIGSVKRLTPAEFLKWNDLSQDGIPCRQLSLQEIAAQFEEYRAETGSSEQVITVFVERIGEGTIFQFNNYNDRSWYKYGQTSGIL